MDRYTCLRERLHTRSSVCMTNISLSLGPFIVDALDACDCMLLDKEHGLYDTESLVPLLMRCREKGMPAIVRVEDTLYHLIAKSLDLGADGIMLPRVETLDQVALAVAAMHFAPIGRTGYGGWGIMRAEEDFNDFNHGRFFFPQIESPTGLDILPSMLDKFGEYIDGIIIGPCDYSVMLGIPRQLDHPLLNEHIQKVFDVCAKYGKSCGCFAADGEHIRRYIGMGANIHWVADDFSYLKEGLQYYMRFIHDES